MFGVLRRNPLADKTQISGLSPHQGFFPLGGCRRLQICQLQCLEDPARVQAAPADPATLRSILHAKRHQAYRLQRLHRPLRREVDPGLLEPASQQPAGRKRSQSGRDDAPRPTATVASESGRSGERRVAPGGCGEGEHETVVSSQWSVVSESGESGEPTKEECRYRKMCKTKPIRNQRKVHCRLGLNRPCPSLRVGNEAEARRQWRMASGAWHVNSSQ